MPLTSYQSFRKKYFKDIDFFFFFFQGSFFALVLAMIGSCFVFPVVYRTELNPGPAIYLDKKYHCEVDWPKEYRHHYTLITSAAHYFLTLIIVGVLYAAIYGRLRAR